MGPASAVMLRRASSRGWPAGKKSNGSRGRAVLPSGASRRGVSAGRAGDRARGQAERHGGSNRWADKLWAAAVRPARLRVGTVSLAHVAEAERAVLTTPGGNGLSPMFADGGAQWSGITATEWSGAAAKLGVRPQTGPPSAAMLEATARGSGRRGRHPTTLCRLRRWAGRSALLETGPPEALVGSRRRTRGRGSSEPRSGEFRQTCPRSG